MSLRSIVQEGPLASSLDRREITPNAFRWTGERSLDGERRFGLRPAPPLPGCLETIGEGRRALESE